MLPATRRPSGLKTILYMDFPIQISMEALFARIELSDGKQ